MQGQATIAELCMLGGVRSVCIVCETGFIPAPGRYVLAHEEGSEAPLAVELFASEYRSNGFVAAPPLPLEWRPGCVLDLRGPLGNGFELPAGSRRVALIAFDGDANRLLPLADAASKQDAAVALVCGTAPSDLPLQMEIHPLRALAEVCAWSDYAAFDVQRESVPALLHSITAHGRPVVGGRGQALIRVPMPCGGMAECGVCSMRTASGPMLACIDGPVFDIGLLTLER